MSLLWTELTHRAGNADLPSDIGPDPDPNEPEQPDVPEVIPAKPVYHLTDADYNRAAATLLVEVAVIRAVCEVEAAGRGFLSDGSGRPQILYEAHVWGRLTGHKFAATRDSNGRALSSRSWDRSLYGPAGVHQHTVRLAGAVRYDRSNALRACSWGLFQIMGENNKLVGHATIQSFVNAMYAGASGHIDAFVQFIKTNKLETSLRNKHWATFARRYNGPGYKQNQYDTKLAAAYKRFSA